jgi:hypothetical protein
MNRHALAAALFSGWLLMQPPLDISPGSGKPKGRVLGGAPIINWNQGAAFDTAAACESARQADIRDGERKLEDARKGGHQATVEVEELLWLQSLTSRCVPADHIYPPRK